ncbi:MAG: hypothetical protein DI617_05495 [Streptococcus pyogenes]|uniref:YkvA family protein n=1 Tax=Streptococcus halichoeri TaxID=254785 RepID=UPI000DB0465C|nr:DUF1232 domain-containing protein [Streptococcus halichoeri]PZO94823.1 MAG: hypothetical protein DI617_05495 [Streptococcus pyogenes]
MVKHKTKKLNFITRIKHLKTNLPAVLFALRDKRTPLLAKLVALLIIIYVLSPIDFIPDFIPFFGVVDDLVLIPILVFVLRSLTPQLVWNDAQKRSDSIWRKGRAKPIVNNKLFIFGGLIVLTLALYLFWLWRQ